MQDKLGIHHYAEGITRLFLISDISKRRLIARSDYILQVVTKRMYLPHSSNCLKRPRQIWSDVALEQLLQESVREHKAGTYFNLATFELFRTSAKVARSSSGCNNQPFSTLRLTDICTDSTTMIVVTSMA